MEQAAPLTPEIENSMNEAYAQVLESVQVPVESGGESQTDETGHLGPRWRQIRGRIEGIRQFLPASVLRQQPTGEVRVHLSSTRRRISIRLGIGIELSEELVDPQQAQGEHQCLIPVVARAEVALAEGTSQGNLSHLFAISEDPELGLARENFLAAQQARLPTLVGDSVVANDALASQVKRDALLRRHGILRRHRRRCRLKESCRIDESQS